jgi:hypothetical protein
MRICFGFHVHILEMNGESYRLAASKKAQRPSAHRQRQNPKTPTKGPATKILIGKETRQ